MTQSTRVRVSFLLYAATSVLTACGLYGVEVPRKPEVGQAVLRITAVPEDVKCLRITASGAGRSEERELDVEAAGEMAATLTGLPIGMVVFKGEAFAGACPSVTKATIAGWASEPVTTSVVLGRLASVTLAMTRNGRAKVEVTFQDEAACTALGGACRIASECCSKRCTTGLCSSPADAAVRTD